MGGRATTPEELEALLEDALVIGDRGAVAELFEDGAVLVPGNGRPEARGAVQIGALVSMLPPPVFVAEPRQILQARGTALVVGDWGINVARHGADGGWRYAIAFLLAPVTTNEEER